VPERIVHAGGRDGVLEPALHPAAKVRNHLRMIFGHVPHFVILRGAVKEEQGGVAGAALKVGDRLALLGLGDRFD
jgi:hypothetical protein